MSARLTSQAARGALLVLLSSAAAWAQPENPFTPFDRGAFEGYMRDKGLDAERSQRAEEIVRGWRESDALPFPDMSIEHRAELKDSVDFPPTGSVARQREKHPESAPDES